MEKGPGNVVQIIYFFRTGHTYLHPIIPTPVRCEGGVVTTKFPLWAAGQILRARCSPCKRPPFSLRPRPRLANLGLAMSTAARPAAQYRHGEDIGVEEDGSHEFKAFQTADPNAAGRFRAEGEICINIVGECASLHELVGIRGGEVKDRPQ